MKSPGCAFFIAVALPFGVSGILSIWAVERWGAFAFWPILIAALVVSWGLLRMTRFTAYREDMRGSLPILCGALIGGMGRALGLSLWQGLLIVGIGGLVVWFLVGRVRPGPESSRNRRVID